MYPLLQGYDSVVMNVDLEIGGTDQEFNMLVGRELLRKFKDKEKFVLTTPMILGTNGKQMAKTAGNCIWLDESPREMYAKLMSLVDDQIVTYMKTVTNIPMDRIEEVDKSLKNKSLHPLDAKKELALAVVTGLHGKTKANKAQEHFEKTFQKRKLPDIQKTVSERVLVDAVATVSGSKSKAKRLLIQKAIEVNGKVVEDPNHKLSGGEIIRIGKKKFVKVGN